MNPAGQLHSGIRPTPWPGSKVKKASSLPAHGDCLSATEQLQTCQEVSWERNRDAAEHRVTWNSIPPDPVCTIQENKPRSETRENGEPRRTHSHGRVDAFRFSRNTCCLATVLVGLTSKYQKAMLLWISEMDWKKKKESNVTDTTLEENWLLKWREKHPWIPSSPSVSLFPSSSLTRSGRLASCQTHFYFNPYTS